jgi:alginate O-acetyltransferase complex protein AlgI
VLFNSLVFLVLFLPLTYVVFWLLRSASARYVWLTVTGYVFYGYWDARFCLLMAFSTLVSYTAGLGFLRFKTGAARTACLAVPVCVDLLLLGFFKYADFLLGTADDVSRACGFGSVPLRLNVILPVGISFYTFHTISYIVDCYRGTIKPTRNLFEFSAYVSLFSQLVAGPIVRFRQIEQDLENLGHADRTRWLGIGISFFVYGLAEKVLLADTLAAFVDPAWKNYENLSSLGVWLAVLGYTFQLYFDFSGYSTMAVGLGYMFGLRIPQNFNSPYKALNPSDFWQRWHISLSSCLRDYLYIPLGGNRGGAWATCRNLMITMLLGGLWHGANWTFILWGAYHGLLLILHRFFGTAWDSLPKTFRQLAFFLLVIIGWVLFRAENVSVAGHMLHAMFVPVAGALMERSEVLGAAIAAGAWWSMIGPNAFDWHGGFAWDRRTAHVLAAVFGACFAIILGGRDSPFLYFQF